MSLPEGWRERVDWRLYVILDPEALAPGHDPRWVAQEALRGGAGVLQLRDKRQDARAALALAQALRPLCEAASSPLIINDRLDVALLSGAHGLHVGPQDLPLDQVRRFAPSLLLGGSAGSVEVARALERAGADYLGCGALFEARASKADASAPKGLEFVRQVTEAVSIPVVGIGGITLERAAAVVQAGARGVAVIRAVTGQADPAQAARQLLASLG